MEIKPLLELENLSAAFTQPVLEGLSLRMNPAERIALIGPSGCGKTTLLNLIAGLAQPASGRIAFKGSPVLGVSRERVIIFQNHALFPWLTARQNIEFAAQGQADAYLKQVGLAEFGDFYPHQLSGGMQQRVGIARALAVNPSLLLLDEPFASLDVINRESVLKDLNRVPRRALILVTHDIEEAIFLADKIYLLSGRPGRISKVISADFSKPETVLEMKRLPAFARIENEIHAHLLTSR